MWKNWSKSGILQGKMAVVRKIEISHRTIVFTVAFLILLWFIYIIREIILVFFVALLIMAILNPWVTKFSKFKIPRVVSIILVYLLFFGLIGIVLAGLLPPLVDQTKSFVNGLPKYLENLGVVSSLSEQVVQDTLSRLGTIPRELLKFISSVFTNVVGVLTVLFFAFYLLLARDKLEEQLGTFFGDKKKKEIGKVIDLLESRLGGWARGQFALMISIGLATYLGLSLLGIPFALPLAILAGILEIIPYIGPILSAVPAVIIGLAISPLIGLATAALYLLIQQIENYVLVPKVMEKSVGVSPIVTLLSLAIGFKLAGIVGAAISIPVVITLQVLSRQYLLSRQN